MLKVTQGVATGAAEVCYEANMHTELKHTEKQLQPEHMPESSAGSGSLSATTADNKQGKESQHIAAVNWLQV